VNLINASFGLGASSAPLLFVAVEHHVGNGLVAFSAIGALAAVPALSATVLRSPLPPPAKLQPQPSERAPATPLKGLGSSHGGSTIFGVDLGSRAAYIRTTVIAPLMLVITLVIGSQIAFAGWVRANGARPAWHRPRCERARAQHIGMCPSHLLP
jgi:hypothetical protein